ncbi:hypothetical protein [Aquisalimonas sp.]|uniref:hypothetical protein n=1 Tax=Aquisalimonas sp. TaxID=1872621 RepID=UPI0025BE7E0B|nr:hypothetical protein [Aquisalimonas sp.]
MDKPTYSLRLHMYRLSLCLLALLCASGVGLAQHSPPPALGPPLASPDDGYLPLSVIRGLIEAEGDEVIADNNLASEHKLSWAGGARPSECGYDCFGRPFMSMTRHLNQPNENVVQVFGRLQFDLDISGFPFDRRVVSNFTVRASCHGWAHGDGNLRIVVEVQPPFVADGLGVIETVLDFILSPLDLSRRINDRVRAALGPGGVALQDLPARCRTLGAFDAGFAEQDGIVWDAPVTAGLPQLGHTFVGEPITVRFESIRRQHVLTNVDPVQPLTFEFYVNHVHLGVPNVGELVLAPGETLVLDNAAIALPVSDLEALLVIVADSLGGAGWELFERGDGFTGGRRTLLTHRNELVPADQLGPGLPPLPPDSQRPGSARPRTIDVHEFRITYTIRVGFEVIGD